MSHGPWKKGKQSKEQRQAKKNAYLRRWAKALRDRLKVAAYAVLGNRCVKCGFSDVRALQIDHLAGNGSEERRQLGGEAYRVYQRVLADVERTRYQLLCANCNWIKRWERGEGK